MGIRLMCLGNGKKISVAGKTPSVAGEGETSVRRKSEERTWLIHAGL